MRSQDKEPNATGKRGLTRGSKKVAKFDDGVTHSPIVITNGSAALEFAEGDYPRVGTSDVHRSAGLSLQGVYADRSHPLNSGNPLGSPTCYSFKGSTRYRIEITCKVGNDQKNFIIEGAAAGGSTKSPTLQFDHNEYRKDLATFPPKFPGKGRFGNAGRKITSLKITIISTGQVVHNCPLATAGGIEYTIDDAHS